VALGLPALVGTALLIRSALGGDDFQPARWLATGSGPSYGQSYLYAYPLPVYLPALPLAAMPTAWSHAAALVVCISLLGLAVWLRPENKCGSRGSGETWRGSWRNWLFLMTSTPAVYALITTHDAQLRPAGLRATQLNLLMAIESEAATTITDLAEILAMDRTTLTRNLKLLRERGLVEKKRIALTAPGRRSAAAALPLWESAQRQFVKSLGRRRWAALLDELSAARASLESRP
jgi:DNA-binding MarR family transcriptional regulator